MPCIQQPKHAFEINVEAKNPKLFQENILYWNKNWTKLLGLSPQANYTDRATDASRQS
jgi:hypothetical protein